MKRILKNLALALVLSISARQLAVEVAGRASETKIIFGNKIRLPLIVLYY